MIRAIVTGLALAVMGGALTDEMRGLAAHLDPRPRLGEDA